MKVPNIIKRLSLGAGLVAMLGASMPVLAKDIIVRKGTDVVLAFDDPLSSRTASPGDKVHFHVAQDVLVQDKVVIKRGTPVTGSVVKVKKRARFGVNAAVQLQMSSLRMVNGRYAPLGFKTKQQLLTNKTGEAAGASAGGALVLGPVGLVAGYFVVGKSVNAKPGDKMTVEVTGDTFVMHNRS